MFIYIYSHIYLFAHFFLYIRPSSVFFSVWSTALRLFFCNDLLICHFFENFISSSFGNMYGHLGWVIFVQYIKDTIPPAFFSHLTSFDVNIESDILLKVTVILKMLYFLHFLLFIFGICWSLIYTPVPFISSVKLSLSHLLLRRSITNICRDSSLHHSYLRWLIFSLELQCSVSLVYGFRLGVHYSGFLGIQARLRDFPFFII